MVSLPSSFRAGIEICDPEMYLLVLLVSVFIVRPLFNCVNTRGVVLQQVESHKVIACCARNLLQERTWVCSCVLKLYTTVLIIMRF